MLKAFRSKSFEKRKIAVSRIKRRFLKHVWLVRTSLIIVLFFLFYGISLLGISLMKATSLDRYATLAYDFIVTPQSKIKSINGRTNILVLGKGGTGHDAPELTDTIIFASVSHQHPSLTLVTLPRDIWLEDLQAKLNSAYYWGNKKEAGGGIVLAKSIVEELTGQPVQYAIVVDFSGFKEMIDIAGGIDVKIAESFTDRQFPIPGRENDLCDGDPEYKCRYETITFTKGIQWMDGETALKFVRSRNAEGEEGTDTARGVRQQKVFAAIKNGLLSPKFIFSFTKIKKLVEVLSQNIETDLEKDFYATIARKMFSARNFVATPSIPSEFLENPPISQRYDDQYVFIPKGGDWSEVKEWLGRLLGE